MAQITLYLKEWFRAWLIQTTWSDQKMSEGIYNQSTCTSSDLSVVSIGRSDPSTSTATETEATKEPSVLSLLRAPKASDLARKRKIASNPPSGKKKSKGPVASEPSNVDARDRLKQFPDELFKVASGNKLFCKACRETISLKKSIIVSHIKCAKHSTGLGRLKLNQKENKTFLTCSRNMIRRFTLSVKICRKMFVCIE